MASIEWVDWPGVRAAIVVGCLFALAFRASFAGEARPPKAEPPLDQLKTFGTMGKAVYPLKGGKEAELFSHCLLYTSPSPRDRTRSRMPSSA